MTGAANSNSAQASDLGREVLRDETAVRWAKSIWKLSPVFTMLVVCWSIVGWMCHPSEGGVEKLLKKAHQALSKTILPVDRRQEGHGLPDRKHTGLKEKPNRLEAVRNDCQHLQLRILLPYPQKILPD